MATINISKTKIEKQKGVVILPLQEYQKLLQGAAPTYYLKGKAAEKLDKLVAQGLKEHQQGKTRIIKSLGDLE